MNHKQDSIKKSTISFLIKYITLLVLVLLCANSVLFGIYYDVNKTVKRSEPMQINMQNTSLKVVLDEITFLSDTIINYQESNIKLNEAKYELFLSALATSDANILSARYMTKDGIEYYFGKAVVDEQDKISMISSSMADKFVVSAPKQEPNLGIKIVTFSKNLSDSKGEDQGRIAIDYQFDAFKKAILTSISHSKHKKLVYTSDLGYVIVDQSNFYIFISEVFKNQWTKIILLMFLLLVSCYIFVNRSYATLMRLVLDLDKNYRKNIKGICLIEEYHLIMGKLDEVKEDIDQKLLKISELKVVESELIRENRYKSKQFEELYKNHTVLKNRALYLSSFFETIAKNIGQMLWIMNTEGDIIYVNQILSEILRFETSIYQCEHISEFIEGFDKDLDLLLERDYKSIKFRFKNHIFNEPLNGSSVRIREFNKVNYILCFCSKSNFEDKMNQNYLKKSRDLHFINEIGKIISVNNNIEATLQDILDKVAFLANLNSTTIRLMNEEQMFELKTISGYSTEFLLNEKIAVEGRHIGYCFKENKIILINTEDDLLFHEPVLEDLLKQGHSIAYIPLANYQKSFGVMSIISDFEFNTDYMVLLESISINVTISLEKVLLYDQLKANYYKTVEAFVTAAEIKQERFSGHSRRVARISRLIAQRLYLNDNEIDDIYIAGLLHDVGKLGFADNSLEYFFDIDEHGIMGRKMIENVGFNKEILDGIEFHHLNYDLSNHPVGLQEQPYYSQIIRLANDFDLFMNYNSGSFDRQHFVEKMTAKSGTVYSPQLLKILEDLIDNKNDALNAIYETKTSGAYDEN